MMMRTRIIRTRRTRRTKKSSSSYLSPSLEGASERRKESQPWKQTKEERDEVTVEAPAGEVIIETGATQAEAEEEAILNHHDEKQVGEEEKQRKRIERKTMMKQMMRQALKSKQEGERHEADHDHVSHR